MTAEWIGRRWWHHVECTLGRLTSEGDTLFALLFFLTLALLLRKMNAEYRLAKDTRPIDCSPHQLNWCIKNKGKDVIRRHQNALWNRQERCLGNEERKKNGQQWNRPTRWLTRQCWVIKLMKRATDSMTISTRPDYQYQNERQDKSGIYPKS